MIEKFNIKIGSKNEHRIICMSNNPLQSPQELNRLLQRISNTKLIYCINKFRLFLSHNLIQFNFVRECFSEHVTLKCYFPTSNRLGTGGNCRKEPPAIICIPPKIISFLRTFLQMNYMSVKALQLRRPISSMINTSHFSILCLMSSHA